jgi:hypothetical protein
MDDDWEGRWAARRESARVRLLTVFVASASLCLIDWLVWRSPPNGSWEGCGAGHGKVTILTVLSVVALIVMVIVSLVDWEEAGIRSVILKWCATGTGLLLAVMTMLVFFAAVADNGCGA